MVAHEQLVQDQWSQQLREEYLGALVAAGAIKIQQEGEPPIILRDKTPSSVYVDHGDVLTMPETGIPFIAALATYVGKTFDLNAVLVNVDSKASPHLAGGVFNYLSDRRQIVVLPQSVAEAEQGTGRRMRLPPNLAGRPPSALVFIDDVANSGDTTVADVAEAVRRTISKQFPDLKLPPLHLVVGLARKEELARRSLAARGIKLLHLVTLDEAIDRAWPTFSPQDKKRLGSEFSQFAGRA